MKKSLLSILAVAAMVFFVACGNGKFVDAQVKAVNAMTAKLDSIQTPEQLTAIAEEWTKFGETYATELGEKKLSVEETKTLTDAFQAYTDKAAALGTKFAEEAAAKAAEEAEAAAKLAEEEAAKAPKKK